MAAAKNRHAPTTIYDEALFIRCMETSHKIFWLTNGYVMPERKRLSSCSRQLQPVLPRTIVPPELMVANPPLSMAVVLMLLRECAPTPIRNRVCPPRGAETDSGGSS